MRSNQTSVGAIILWVVMISCIGTLGGMVYGAHEEGAIREKTSITKSSLEQRRESLMQDYQTLQQQMAEGQANLLRIEGAIRIIDLTLEDNKTTATDSVSTGTVKRN